MTNRPWQFKQILSIIWNCGEQENISLIGFHILNNWSTIVYNELISVNIMYLIHKRMKQNISPGFNIK